MNETELKARVRQSILAKHYQETGEMLIPVTVSSRHVHLDQKSLDILFGQGHQLTRRNDLVQLGQFACEETLTLHGKKKAISNIRILGPVRNYTQIELSTTDCYVLGIEPVLKMSGEIEGTSSVTLEGSKGKLTLAQGAMVAMRHLHVPASLAPVFGLTGGDTVSIITTGERPAVLMQCVVRVSDGALLEAHVDTDEANACGITNNMLCRIIREGAPQQR